MEFELENPLVNMKIHDNLHCYYDDDDVISSLFLIESEHTPSQSYLQGLKDTDFGISLRREVIALISQFSCSLDRVIPYLAINYLDRFLANEGILQPKPWILRLLSISCISLAFKMMRTEYSATDFQALVEENDGGVIIFETQTVQRMEGLILGALQWRMRSITPFSFINFFITLFELKDHSMEQVLKERAYEIIFKSQPEMKLLEFKPSIIAAAALLIASHELLPFQYPCFLAAVSNCSYVNRESMVECYNVMEEEVIGMEYECVMNGVSSSGTPVNVLDHHFLSSEESGEKTNGITSSTHKDLKRRKINHCFQGNDQRVQVSRITEC